MSALEITPSDHDWLASVFTPNQKPSQPQALLEEEQSVSFLVLRARERLGSITTLLGWLHTYKKQLDDELHQLIEVNYKSFLELHEKNHHLLSLIKELRPNIGLIKQSLNATLTSLSKEKIEIEAYLLEAHQLAAKKKTLELFIQVSELVTKLQKLLDDRFVQDHESLGRDSMIPHLHENSQLNQECSHVQRIANQYHQLRYYVTEGVKFPFVQSLSGEIFKIEHNLLSRLEKLITVGFKTVDAALVASCLTSYEAIYKIERAADLFQTYLNLELDEIFAMHLEKDGFDLAILHENILKMIKTKCFYLLTSKPSQDLVPLEGSPKKQTGPVAITNGADTQSSSFTGYDFLTNCIWPSIEQQFSTKLSKIFLPGIPQVFYINYCNSLEFLKNFETLYQNDPEDETAIIKIQQFRKSPAYQKFMRKWPLLFYFNSQFKQLSGQIKTDLSAPVVIQANSDFYLQATNTCWTSISKCWNECYLYSLSHQYFKFTIQIIRQYGLWCNQQIGTVFGGLSVSDLCFVFADVTKLQNKLYLEMPQLLNANKTTGVLPQEVQTSILAQISLISTKEIQPLIDRLVSEICADLVRQTTSQLQNIQSIPRAYRLTNAPPPSCPMEYAKNLLNPLKQFQTKYDHVPPAIFRGWATHVLNIIVPSYLSMGKTLIEAELKKDSVLSKTASRKIPLNPNPRTGELSDSEKMNLQVILDIEFFLQSVQQFGFNNSEINGLEEMNNFVQKPSK